MIVSRFLEDLHPRVAKKARALIVAAAEESIELVVLSTYRDIEAQRWLYESGRKREGPILTTAMPGSSFHQYRMAFDVMPLLQGKPLRLRRKAFQVERRTWGMLGEMGKALGLDWGGDFERPRQEFGHFQLTEGLTIADLKAGRRLR